MNSFLDENAIFIKEKEYEPNSTSKDIIQIKLIITIFFISIVATLIAFHAITVVDAAKLQSYSQQYITFMQCYRLPMILGNSYLQSTLGIGNQSKIASQIAQLSTTFTALASNPIIL